MLTLNINKLHEGAPMHITQAVKRTQEIAIRNQKTVRLIFGGICILVPVESDTAKLVALWKKQARR